MYYGALASTGLLALGGGTFLQLYHRHQPQIALSAASSDHRPAWGQSCPDSQDEVETECVPGRAAVPKQLDTQDPKLVLQLKQVQVIFRHGARTPLHMVDSLKEANYQKEFIAREHQASNFPYQTILECSREPADWSDYEIKLTEKPIKSGVCPGYLSAYGKDQVYLLGRCLRDSYRDSLNMATYDPKDVFVLSSNIKRTVESARCVLAGYYGKEQLKAFAELCCPVQILVTDEKYNVLIPEVVACDILRKVNHTSMFHSDSIEDIRQDREKLQDELKEYLEPFKDDVRESQERIDQTRKCSSNMPMVPRRMVSSTNPYRQEYMQDTEIEPLYWQRSRAMEKVDQIWVDAMVRHPELAKFITATDMKALKYLRRVEVEEFNQPRPGYRFHFCFDPNPYFRNTHLWKEIYRTQFPCAAPSKSEPILWKCCADMTKTGCDCESLNRKRTKKNCFCKGKASSGCNSLSFFKWYMDPVCQQHDKIGRLLREEIWPNPLIPLETGKGKFPDPRLDALSFINLKDDLTSRRAHGLDYPGFFNKHLDTIEAHATSMLHSAMTGICQSERTLVTRLSAGPLVSRVADFLENMTQCKDPTPKLVLFSTHDSTLTAVLEALGIWKDEWPPFAADLRIELYKDISSTEHYVRIRYCGKVQRMPQQREDFMHYKDFKRSICRFVVTPEQYWQACCSSALEKLSCFKYVDAPACGCAAKK